MNQWMNESTLPYFSKRRSIVSAGWSDIFATQPPPLATRPSQHRGDVVGVADSISTHVVDKSLGLPRPRKNSFPRSRRFVPLGKQSRIATPMPNRRRSHTHARTRTYVYAFAFIVLFLAFGGCRSPINRSLPHNPRHRCSLSTTWSP